MANRRLLHKLMFPILCLALLVSTGCRRGSSTPPAGSGSPTPTGLDGSWKATAAEFEGQPLVPLEGLGMMMGLDISGTQIKCKFQGIDFAEGTIQFDPKPQPNTIDIKLTVLRGRVGGQSVAGQTGEIRGICELSGDRLRLCYFMAGSNAAQQGQRPTAFQGSPKSGIMLVTYQRVR